MNHYMKLTFNHNNMEIIDKQPYASLRPTFSHLFLPWVMLCASCYYIVLWNISNVCQQFFYPKKLLSNIFEPTSFCPKFVWLSKFLSINEIIQYRKIVSSPTSVIKVLIFLMYTIIIIIKYMNVYRYNYIVFVYKYYCFTK